MDQWQGRIVKLTRFLLAGVPGFGIALASNWSMVDGLGWPRPLAYGITLLVQMTFNFFVCRWFVFETDYSKPVGAQYLQFISGLAVFRLADWLFYNVLVVAGIHYLAAQALNIVVFSLARLRFLERLFEYQNRAAE